VSHIEDLAKAKKYAFSLLKIRPRSEKEIRSRLSGKNYSDSICDSVLEHLKNGRYVDDLGFAKLLIEKGLGPNTKSKEAIAKDMLDHGLDEGTIEKAFEKENVNDRANAKRLVNDRLDGMKGVPVMKVKARLYALLLRNGFEAELAEEIINDIQ